MVNKEGKKDLASIPLEGKYTDLKNYEKYKSMVRNKNYYREKKKIDADLDISRVSSSDLKRKDVTPQYLIQRKFSQESTMVPQLRGPLPKLLDDKDLP